MTDTMKVLFQYAQEQMERPLLLLEPEYTNIRHCVDEQEKRLRAMLNSEAKQCLDTLLNKRNLLRYFEDQALFRTGFQIAMELAR